MFKLKGGENMDPLTILVIAGLITIVSVALTGCEEKEKTDLEVYDKEDNIDAVKKCAEGEGKPCVCGARVVCTSATDPSESVHILKLIDGENVKVADIEQLNKYDVIREKKFTGCRFSPDKQCTLDFENYIEDFVWKDIDNGYSLGADSEALDANRSFMVCTYGYGIIYFENSGQVFKNYIEEFVSEKFDENNLQEYEVNDWLILYKNPTVSAYGRSVLKHPDANNYDWGMPEELKGIKELKRGELTSNSKTEIQNAGGKVVVNMTSNNLYTDDEGRYWVAVGPNVMNPNHNANDKITASEMQYGTKIDIVVLDELTNTQYYIPAVVGDVKGHSSPDGLYQTGVPFDKSKKIVQGDGSTVEFMGYDITNKSVNITNNYRLIEIIVYEGEVNY